VELAELAERPATTNTRVDDSHVVVAHSAQVVLEQGRVVHRAEARELLEDDALVRRYLGVSEVPA